VAIVAGSGLGGLAQLVHDPVRVPYGQIPGVAHPGELLGHAGELVAGTMDSKRVIVFAGRLHCYQGVSALDAAFTTRIAAALRVPRMVLTNAAGGVSARVHPGDIVLIADQVNLTGTSPLIGWTGPEGGVPFVPMRDAYDTGLRALAHEVALEQAIPLIDGVYFGLLGPAFETPAEVEMFARLGADVVGMSTVHEVIAARALGIDVLGFSLVTNVAAGVGLSHTEVLEAGEQAAASMERLVLGILRRL
jgi:purine-nucleoside phosphorylase